MKITNLDFALKDEFDKPLPYREETWFTFKDACIKAVLTPVQGDDEKQKADKYDIYLKLKYAKNNEIELSVDDAKVLKSAIGKIHPQLIMGQCFEIIEKIKP